MFQYLFGICFVYYLLFTQAGLAFSSSSRVMGIELDDVRSRRFEQLVFQGRLVFYTSLWEACPCLSIRTCPHKLVVQIVWP